MDKLSAGMVASIRAHLAGLDGCPTFVLHPDDYAAHFAAAFGELELDGLAWFRTDASVPRGCWIVKTG